MNNNERVAELELMISQMENQIRTAEQLIDTCKTQITSLRDHVARIRSLPDEPQE
ncbi:MAG TPA: hypothetical protein VGJ04_00720 [Pirellulales bacterium]|jgi:uncharacterized protein HemX